MGAAPRTPQDRRHQHESRIMDIVLTRFRDAVRNKLTGKMTIEIQLNQGGPTHVYTEVGITCKFLEDSQQQLSA